MPQIFVLPRQLALDDDANPLAGALLYFFATETTTTQAVYSDATLTTPITQPVVADAAGEFPKIYLNPEAAANYRMRLTTSDGAMLYQEDDIDRFTVSQAEIVRSVYPRTTAEIAADITPVDYSKKAGNIRRYFNTGVIDGTTDVSYAVRKALDLAASNGTTVTCDPPGQIKIGSTVYIPQRRANEAQLGFLMDFYGSTFIGQGRGTGTIFETGTGSLSTGGATNFGQTDESATSLHQGTIIAGARFRECEYVLRAFNFVKGCKLRDLYAEDVDHVLLAERCFYLELDNCHAQVSVITAGHVLFDFTEENNAITVIGCEAGGGLANATGIGFRFTGASAVTFIGNTAEALDKGLVLNGTIRGIDLQTSYFEGITTTAIDGTASGSKEFTVDNNWFLNCAEVIDCVEWISGRFGDANHIAGTGGTVRIADPLSECLVEVPQQNFTEAQGVSTALLVPATYVLGNAVQLRAPRQLYAASIGGAAPIAIDRQDGPSTPAFAYSGGAVSNGASFLVPFCSQTLSVGSSVIDTQILWNVYHMHVYFGFYTEINGAKVLTGIVGYNGTVYRLDALTNISITASNNAGKLRLTIAGSDHATYTSAGFWGQIRHL